MKKEDGFTLIEMMIVLLVISVLLVITIPNITKHTSNIQDKGCEAFIKMVQAQVQAYEIEKNALPETVADLVAAQYLNSNETSCPNGKPIQIVGGTVTESP
ncbi:competence protein ComG [Bacillus canaveralius]|uniref:ComG operon protein 3 n=1 Tax=Bacillus canaveralius TaxID=1403243 RepID=A0A2N5GR91_9BACI|nr:competence type IV pilus major pilin ComGC [Bacillus canaveralius]PLR85966.1 competence protein ComG [Bacillus canaveralius]PLS00085.1 competence protein ComG [Bacillus canaveralius]